LPRKLSNKNSEVAMLMVNLKKKRSAEVLDDRRKRRYRDDE
jgi:hypothetical protein